MSVPLSRPVLRWLAPLVFLLLVAGTALVAGNASADHKLPPRTAEQLLVDLQQAEIEGLSGTVVQRAELGIPEIPGVGGTDSSEFSSLISGSHTMRVWFSAPAKGRVALLGELGESDVITNGTDVWTWSSENHAVTHRPLTDQERQRAQDGPPTPTKTPMEVAQSFLAAVEPTTEVSTDSDVEVAGRDAYELVLSPKDTRSLLTEVRIAVDGAELVPLRVRVFAGTGDPVAEVGFTDVDFTRPDDAQFEFTPPPGAEVSEVPAPQHPTAQSPTTEPDGEAAPDPEDDPSERPTVVGEGWTAVLVGTLDRDGGSSPDPGSGSGEIEALLEQLPRVSGAWGSGRVLAGTAFSVVVTDDGRFAAGAVKPGLLYEALGG